MSTPKEKESAIVEAMRIAKGKVALLAAENVQLRQTLEDIKSHAKLTRERWEYQKVEPFVLNFAATIEYIIEQDLRTLKSSGDSTNDN